MSSSPLKATQSNSMPSLGKAQVQQNKARESDTGFNALFAQAMGQGRSPWDTLDKTLNSPQDEERPKKEPALRNLNAEMSQAALWSQQLNSGNQTANRPAPTDYSTRAGEAVQPQSVEGTKARESDRHPRGADRPEARNPETESTDAQEQGAEQRGTTASKDSQRTGSAEPADPSSNNAATQSADSANGNAPASLSTTPPSSTQNTSAAVPASEAATSAVGPGALGQTTQGPAGNGLQATEGQQPSQLAKPDKARALPTDVLTTINTNGSTQATTDAAQPAVNPVSATPMDARNVLVAAQIAQQRGQTTETDAELALPVTSTAGKQPLDASLTAANLGQAQTTTINARGNTPALELKTPVNQPGFAKELGQTVQWSLARQMNMVDIRVNPESLGPMNLRLVQQGQQWQLVIRTQDDNATNLMQQAVAGLKDVMAANGVQLNQVQVHTTTAQNSLSGQNQDPSAFARQQGSDSRQSRGQAGGRQPDDSSSTSTGAIADSSSATASPKTTRQGGVDLFA